jgi:predicted Abi (CAAX) family protease
MSYETALSQFWQQLVKILFGTAQKTDRAVSDKLSNYERYQQAAFNRPEFYPIDQSVSPEYYRPIAPWMGRLIFPAQHERQTIQGALFEIHHAPGEFQHLVGQIVMLRFSDDRLVQAYVRAVTKDVHFSPQAERSQQKGIVHPTRLNHWRQVNPLESIAGSHPHDDVIVMLQDPVFVEEFAQSNILTISREPVQITGRYYGLVKFVRSLQPNGDLFEVIHFDRASRQFAGSEEIVSLPPVIPNSNQTASSTSKNIEKSPLNETGWYIYGAPDRSGRFVVQAIAPRSLLQVEADRQIAGKTSVKHYLKHETWSNLVAQKGKTSKALFRFKSNRNPANWYEGKRALLIHIYGGIGGKKAEPATKTPLYFGHFAYGLATVVREPLANELRFDIVYHQIYAHNKEGLIAGSLHWSRYMGDRQLGWLGLRPVCDTIIEFDAFTSEYETQNGPKRSPLDRLIYQLEIMAARYRIGDGTGGTFVGPDYNCTQDSNQALYAAMRQIARSLLSLPNIEASKQQHPEELDKLEQLEQLSKELKRLLLPCGTARADWKNQDEVLGSTLEDHPLQKIRRSLLSWRTILPRLTSDEVTQAFLEQGGEAWVLRTNQVGGFNREIEPVAPMTL